eukprot:1139991-Pelagomonas_calceolata.AAC.1
MFEHEHEPASMYENLRHVSRHAQSGSLRARPTASIAHTCMRKVVNGAHMVNSSVLCRVVNGAHM